MPILHIRNLEKLSLEGFAWKSQNDDRIIIKRYDNYDSFE